MVNFAELRLAHFAAGIENSASFTDEDVEEGGETERT
jgi:hypothetical protein